jgi:gas vesicle protein
MAHRAEFMAGLVVGAVIGFGIGVLLTPRTGEEMRRRLGGEADRAGGRLRGRAQDVGGRLKNRAAQVGDRMRESAGEVASKVRDTLDEQARRFRIANEREKESGPRRSDETVGRIDPEQN